ncbi:hypothetical protein HDV00_008164 [Rhizophlyctis rosea]|nr:hypothetical protein HDV00_008164 [Rhizophlyctis rosea]
MSSPVVNETTPLLTTYGPSQPVRQPKGRCWCCWEETDTSRNPLIRVCLGCKDPDLQFIHQECIDKYVSNLPPPPVRREDAFNALRAELNEAGRPAAPSALVGVLEFIQEAASSSPLPGFSFGSINQPNNTPTPSPGPSTTTTPPPEPAPAEALPPTDQPQSPDYYCTRCRHPYTVKTYPIHPIRVAWSDPFLRYSILLMFICIVILTVCCTILLYQYWGTDTLVWDIGVDWLNLRMDVFAGSILVICHAVNAGTWYMVLDHCKGRTRKSVKGIPEEEFGYGGVDVGSRSGSVEDIETGRIGGDNGSSVVNGENDDSVGARVPVDPSNLV